MNCAEKLLEPTIFFNLYTKSFRKSFAQERFKSNLEFRYQIIVSIIKFKEGFAKFVIALFNKNKRIKQHATTLMRLALLSNKGSDEYAQMHWLTIASTLLIHMLMST